eukprot:TRINITY_DN6249_c0_g1_i1.p1 TRINITY_DN6249_c0_g1~~TRINITY_DN6249_c0_g1_i1.p1  ORF type:complete len:219 (+),score=18.15 TRINITY_DN6249_c0_g1_i1:31-687(+)
MEQQGTIQSESNIEQTNVKEDLKQLILNSKKRKAERKEKKAQKKTKYMDTISTKNEKEGQVGKEQQPDPNSSTSCQFFLKKKKRFCNQHPKEGFKYCPNHMAVYGGKKRIPCPFDPRHTIYEDKIKKHLKICVAGKKNVAPYIDDDLNAGTDDENESKKSDQNTNEDKPIPTTENDTHNQVQNTTELYVPLALNEEKKGSSAIQDLVNFSRTVSGANR